MLAGAAKTVRPANTARALRQLGWPGSPPLVRCLGVFEVALGTAAAITGNRIAAALLALSYAGFAAFVATALRRGGAVSSCGCFGRPDTPPTASHLAKLKEDLAARPAKLIVRAAYQEARPSEWLSAQTGIPAVVLPFTVGGSDGARDLFGLFDDTIDRLLKAAR